MEKITIHTLKYFLLGILGTVCYWFHAYFVSEVFINLIQLEREKAEKALTDKSKKRPKKSKKRPHSEYGNEPVKKRAKKHEGVCRNLSVDSGVNVTGSYQFPIGIQILYASHFVDFLRYSFLIFWASNKLELRRFSFSGHHLIVTGS